MVTSAKGGLDMHCICLSKSRVHHRVIRHCQIQMCGRSYMDFKHSPLTLWNYHYRGLCNRTLKLYRQVENGNNHVTAHLNVFDLFIISLSLQQTGLGSQGLGAFWKTNVLVNLWAPWCKLF